MQSILQDDYVLSSAAVRSSNLAGLSSGAMVHESEA